MAWGGAERAGNVLGGGGRMKPPNFERRGRRARAWCVATHLPGRDVEISGQSLAHVQRREVLHLEDLLEEVERRRRNKPARLRVAIERLAGGHASCMGLLSVLHDDWLARSSRGLVVSAEASRLCRSVRDWACFDSKAAIDAPTTSFAHQEHHHVFKGAIDRRFACRF